MKKPQRVYLSTELDDRIQMLSATTNTSVSGVLALLVEAGLANYGKSDNASTEASIEISGEVIYLLNLLVMLLLQSSIAKPTADQFEQIKRDARKSASEKIQQFQG